MQDHSVQSSVLTRRRVLGFAGVSERPGSGAKADLGPLDNPPHRYLLVQ